MVVIEGGALSSSTEQSRSVSKGYKQTEVGVIPEDWECIPIGEILNFKNGLNKESQYFGYGTPIVNYMDVFGLNEILQSDIKGKVYVNSQEQINFSAKLGDVFFTRTSETVEEIGIAATLVDDVSNCVFSGFLLRGRPKNKKICDDFKKYCFNANSVRRQIISTSSYTTRALTNGRLLSNVYLAFPQTHEEQKAIATALSDVDALISNLEKLIVKKKAIKQGAMQQLLTGKNRLPGFSGEWIETTMGSVAKVGTGSKNTQDRVSDGKYPFFVRSQTIERINSYSFDGEGILTAGDGVGTGKVFHYINEKVDIHQRVYLISEFKNKIDGYFIFLIFKENFYARIMSMTAKSSVDSVRKEMITDMEIFIPPTLNEQKGIASILREMETEIEALMSKKAKYLQLKQGMMQELLTGKTRLV